MTLIYQLLTNSKYPKLTKNRPNPAFQLEIWVKPWRGNEIYWGNLLESQDYSLAVTDSAQPKLNMQNFGRFQIPVPPEAEQNKIADFVVRRSADCDKVKDTLSSQITTLTAYRKSLIHECVNGKRRIAEADVARVEAHV